jgi:hypothetical protein
MDSKAASISSSPSLSARNAVFFTQAASVMKLDAQMLLAEPLGQVSKSGSTENLK